MRDSGGCEAGPGDAVVVQGGLLAMWVSVKSSIAAVWGWEV